MQNQPILSLPHTPLLLIPLSAARAARCNNTTTTISPTNSTTHISAMRRCSQGAAVVARLRPLSLFTALRARYRHGGVNSARQRMWRHAFALDGQRSKRSREPVAPQDQSRILRILLAPPPTTPIPQAPPLPPTLLRILRAVVGPESE